MTWAIQKQGVAVLRRSNTWPAHLKCRDKGKAVIVRIGSINPAGLQVGPVALWSRRFVSVLALFASVAALVLIVESQYGQRPFGESLQGPLDALSRASHADAKRGQPAVLSRTEESRHRAHAGSRRIRRAAS